MPGSKPGQLSLLLHSKALWPPTVPNFYSTVRSLANAALNRVGAEIVPLRGANGSNNGHAESSASVSAASLQYLKPDNPKLVELRKRYGKQSVKHSLWSNSYLSKELELKNFRGDNAYIYQKRYASDAAYALTTEYVLKHDELGLFERLRDDELFGNYLVNLDDDFFVSRDLLDSVLEINFLNRELKLTDKPELSILDIGAGYGRLAHRLVESLPNLNRVLCTDAVAESTFVSDFYLKFRKVEDKALVVPLDCIESTLASTAVDLVTNIHSFGECTFESITWWLDLIASNNIPYLFIVANGEELGSREVDGTNIEYLSLILARGYVLKKRQQKYAGSRSVQKFGLYPTNYFLFERADNS